MKLILGTEIEMDGLEHQQFSLGAPFSCFLKGDSWDNTIELVGKNTSAWQSVQYSEGLGSHYIVHIDEFPFSDKTLSEYFEEYYGDPLIMERIADATIIEVEGEEEDQVIWNLKEDIVEDLTTPQDYVVSNVYSKYAVAELEI